VTLLWHEKEPVGICVFTAPARSLRLRSAVFGPLAARAGRSRLGLQRLNQQLWRLARVVLHPTYRGTGIAAAFVRASCQACPVAWIETLAALGHIHPLFEKAGFRRIGVVSCSGRRSERGYCQLYGSGRLTQETRRKSRQAQPVYYLFDNRQRARSAHVFDDQHPGAGTQGHTPGP
jgi:GNAT superfamily N-acetyltransferase